MNKFTKSKFGYFYYLFLNTEYKIFIFLGIFIKDFK